MRYALLTLLFSLAASAQTFEEVTALRIHETPMGARSTAMGASTEALTPDGTDLSSNPALLASITAPVFSLSAAQDAYRVVRFSATPTSYFVVDSQGRDARALTHVAAVIPMHGFVLGAYARQEPALRDFVAGFPVPVTMEYTPPCQEPCEYAYGVNPANFEHRDRRYGLSAAMERGAFSFGAGAEMQELDESYDVWRLALPQAVPFMERVTRNTHARKVVPNAGVRWRVSPRFALAAAYNGAPDQVRSEVACLGDWPQNACISNTVQLDGTRIVRGADAYRVSATFAPASNVVLVGEAVRRDYSSVPREGLAPLNNHDVTEWHAGAEYRLRNTPVALRAGWWREPGKVPANNYGFYGVDAETIEHRTIGAGIDIGRGARLDLAYDDADGPTPRRALVGVAFRTGH